MKLRLFVLVVVEGEESSWEVVTCEDAVSPRERPETHFRVREEVFRKTFGMQLAGTIKEACSLLTSPSCALAWTRSEWGSMR